MLEIFIGIVCVKNVYVQKDDPCKGTENLLMVNIISSVMNKEITSYLISYVGIVKTHHLASRKHVLSNPKSDTKLFTLCLSDFPKD